MSGAINSRGRRGSTVVPNWRWEDPTLDCYTLRVAGWLASHADSYIDAHVGRNKIADALHVSRERVSTSLAVLEQLGIIEIDHATNARMRITFDFDVWEQGGRQASTSDDDGWTPGDPQVDARRPALEVMHVEEHVPPLPPLAGGVTDADGFDAFWAAYPVKVGKPRARRAWIAAMKTTTPEAVSVGLARWIGYWDARGQRQYIPHPSTWLNDHRWENDPPPLGGIADAQSRGQRAMSVIERMAKGDLHGQR